MSNITENPLIAPRLLPVHLAQLPHNVKLDYQGAEIRMTLGELSWRGSAFWTVKVTMTKNPKRPWVVDWDENEGYAPAYLDLDEAVAKAARELKRIRNTIR